MSDLGESKIIKHATVCVEQQDKHSAMTNEDGLDDTEYYHVTLILR